MFDISTPSAGKVNFIGTGTANFNQAIGTNNNFNVGSSTALGVNASASSTADYMSEGAADLQLAGTSRLQQTIGTATSAFNVSTASEASATSANTAATEVANSTYQYGSEWTEGYSNGLVQREGWEFRAAGASGASEGEGWYSTQGANAGEYVKSTAATKEADFERFARADWKRGWDDVYKSTYETTYAAAVASSQTQNSNSSSQTSDRSGIISGEFSTIDYGSTTTSVSSEDTTQMQTDANAAAAKHIAYDPTATGDKYSIVAGGNYDSQTMTQEEMKNAYNSEYTKVFDKAFASAAGMMRSSDSTVTVTGLGVIADVNASDSSSFKASSKLITGAERDGNGNGNASSGANLATSSYANQSNSSTASAFMQAFSGGLPDPEGTTTIDKVNPIYQTAGNSSTPVTGYTITTSKTTTTTTDTAYDVDVNGVLTAK